jgi:hypothetical protein
LFIPVNYRKCSQNPWCSGQTAPDERRSYTFDLVLPKAQDQVPVTKAAAESSDPAPNVLPFLAAMVESHGGRQRQMNKLDVWDN